MPPSGSARRDSACVARPFVTSAPVSHTAQNDSTFGSSSGFSKANQRCVLWAYVRPAQVRTPNFDAGAKVA